MSDKRRDRALSLIALIVVVVVCPFVLVFFELVDERAAAAGAGTVLFVNLFLRFVESTVRRAVFEALEEESYRRRAVDVLRSRAKGGGDE